MFNLIPWQAWVAAILSAILLGMGYMWHRGVVDYEVGAAKAAYELRLASLNADLHKAEDDKNSLISAIDKQLLDNLASSKDAMREALEKARAYSQPDSNLGKCFTDIDGLRLVVRAPTRVR